MEMDKFSFTDDNGIEWHVERDIDPHMDRRKTPEELAASARDFTGKYYLFRLSRGRVFALREVGITSINDGPTELEKLYERAKRQNNN